MSQSSIPKFQMSTPEKVRVSELLGMVLRHGQCLLVYPSAFERKKPQAIRTPATIGIPYIAPLIRTPDGVHLSCYLLPQTIQSLQANRGKVRPPKRKRRKVIEDCRVHMTPAASAADATVIVFHGNAAHHWEDMETAEDFFNMRCNVFLASYRGYSLSGGTPTEKGLRIDAQTALEYVLNDPYLSKSRIVLYGQSLGGAVAIDLASRNPTKISALIVSNTFTSIPDIVQSWPIIGNFSFLCTQRWNSASKLCRIPVTTPILMLSGRNDEVVPARLMDRLWELASKRGKGKKKVGVTEVVSWGWRRWRQRRKVVGVETEPESEKLPIGDVFEQFENGRHCSTPNLPEYWDAVRKFMSSVCDEVEFLTSPVKEWKNHDVRWRYIMGGMVVEEL